MTTKEKRFWLYSFCGYRKQDIEMLPDCVVEKFYNDEMAEDEEN